MSSRTARRSAGLAVAMAAVVVAAGCAARRPGRPSIDLLAVLPIEAAAAAAGAVRAAEDPSQAPLPEDAGEAVTAQIYGVLADRSDFRFVPDLTVIEALDRPAVRGAASLDERAHALGRAVKADGVIFGSVSRFRERVGTEFGATAPAAVSFELSLLKVATGEVIWRGRFDQTQRPLSANLFNFWMFWRAGPRWFTARELARLGVEKLLRQMRDAARSA